jgi:phytoene synthase
MLDSVEQWLENRKFKTEEDYRQFAQRLGGSIISMLVPILGLEHDDLTQDEQAAMEQGAQAIGKSITVTQLLTNFASNLKRGRVFLPEDLLNEYHCKLSEMRIGNGGDGFRNLINQLASEAHAELLAGAEKFSALSFDGQRVLKSVLSMNLKLIEKIKDDPDAILERPVELTTGEKFKFQMKHLMGTEGTPEFAHLSERSPH